MTDKLEKALPLIKLMIGKEILQTNLEDKENIKALVNASKHAVCIIIILQQLQRGKIIFYVSKVLNLAQIYDFIWQSVHASIELWSGICNKQVTGNYDI